MKTEIKSELYDDISEYCRLNDLGDVDLFINNLLKTAFTIEKYGSRPQIGKKTIETHIEEPIEVVAPVPEPIVEPIVPPVINNTYKKDIYGE